MSHGGGENEGVREKSICRTASQKRNHFGRDLAKLSVAQICESTGFQSFQHSALEKLSDVAIRYLQSIAKSAQSSANFSGRSQANVFDILQSLEEHQSSQGFASASNIHHCLAASGAIKGIAQYVSDTENSSFAYTIPSFPLTRERTATPSFSQANEKPPVHIPSWLPTFPDPHKTRSDTQFKASRKAVFTCNGQEPIRDNPKEVNPFLMPPLPSISFESPARPVVYEVSPFDNDAKTAPREEEKIRPRVQFKFAAKRANELKGKPTEKEEKKVRIGGAVNNSVEKNGGLA